jgi:hypothetical protein
VPIRGAEARKEFFLTMRKIRIKKKPRRKIRIKRRGAPHRVAAVLARMLKRGQSLSHAARAEHTTPRTVLKFARKQLKRNASGHYTPTFGRRELNVLSFDGYEVVSVRSSKQAHLASKHLIAVGRFLRTGDIKSLKPFRGKRIGGIELLTDPDRLREFAEADVLKLDGLYRDQRGHGGHK